MMNVTYATVYDAQNVLNWSGTAFYIAQSLIKQDIALNYIGSLKDQYALLFKGKKAFYQALLRKRYLLDREPSILKGYAQQIAQQLSRRGKTDFIVSPSSIPLAYLETKTPMVLWSDCTFAGIVDFYAYTSNLCKETLVHGNQMEQSALDHCQLVIYSSEWAAQTAIDYYHISPEKVKVVPYGANIAADRNLSEIKGAIESRDPRVCKLLFLGVDWFRKGGHVAFEVAKQLNQSGLNTELTVVGCQPVLDDPLPDYIKCLGFISKSTSAGRERLEQLIAESHFLILPSVADCTPIVFCEASSLGVPCLSTTVGGIPTTIQNDKNGKLFSPEASISDYCHYIQQLFDNYPNYQALALSSFNEYQSRLNWAVAGKAVKQLLTEL